jgi:anti-sigma regulatory factor (Ser/Thr protein kinase)
MMEDLSLHVLDLVENAIAAGAERVGIAVNENERRDLLTIRVTDDGRGMSPEEKRLALDPFFTTKRKRTGLGLPLLAQTAALAGGKVVIASAPTKGTKITASFRYHHIDRPPLTKMAETMMMLVFGHPEIDFRYRHRRNGRDFNFQSLRFLAGTGAGPAWAPERIDAVGRALREGLGRIGTR